MKKRLTVFLAILIALVMVVAGCSMAAAPEYDYNSDSGYYGKAEVVEEPAAPEAASVEVESEEGASTQDQSANGGGLNYEGSVLQPGVDRKIIFYGYFEMRSKEFDADYNTLLENIKEMGGYIEESSMSGTKPEDWRDAGRHASLVLRVPSKNFDKFVGKLGQLGETVSSSINGTDVSLEYFDTETKLKTLRTREKRLLELLEKAAGLEDIIKLEQELANVSYEIQMLETQLRDYDSLIDYSKVTIEFIEVNQVEEVTPPDESLGGRISNAFFSVLNALADFGEFLLVVLIGGAPILIPLAGITVLIIFLVKRSNKKKKTHQGDNAPIDKL